MKNVFFAVPAVSRTRRLTCAWVPTGDRKNPLACVWSYNKPSHSFDTPHSLSVDEVDRMPQCA